MLNVQRKGFPVTKMKVMIYFFIPETIKITELKFSLINHLLLLETMKDKAKL